MKIRMIEHPAQAISWMSTFDADCVEQFDARLSRAIRAFRARFAERAMDVRRWINSAPNPVAREKARAAMPIAEIQVIDRRGNGYMPATVTPNGGIHYKQCFVRPFGEGIVPLGTEKDLAPAELFARCTVTENHEEALAEMIGWIGCRERPSLRLVGENNDHDA